MAFTAHNQFIGIADAGRMARREFIARVYAEGQTLPTFRKLRS